jgi:hypothetical protein
MTLITIFRDKNHNLMRGELFALILVIFNPGFHVFAKE